MRMSDGIRGWLVFSLCSSMMPLRLWIHDNSPLKLCVKSHQTGFSWCNCYRLVIRPRLIT